MSKNITEETRLHREERKKEKKRRKIKKRVWTAIKYCIAFIVPICMYVGGFLTMQPANKEDFTSFETTVNNLQVSERKSYVRRGVRLKTDIVFPTEQGDCYYTYYYKIKENIGNIEYFEELQESQRKVLVTVDEKDKTGRFKGNCHIIDLRDGDKTIVSFDAYNHGRKIAGIVQIVVATTFLVPVLLYSGVSFLMKKDNYKNRINKKIKKHKKNIKLR